MSWKSVSLYIFKGQTPVEGARNYLSHLYDLAYFLWPLPVDQHLKIHGEAHLEPAERQVNVKWLEQEGSRVQMQPAFDRTKEQIRFKFKEQNGRTEASP